MGYLSSTPLYVWGFFVCPRQSSMPTSSSPVSTPSAWCHVAWEKTRQCILLSAPPWYTQRRLSLSRDASSSSTTLTVSSFTMLFLISFLDKKQTKVHFSRLILHPYPLGSAHPSLLPLFFTLLSSSLFFHSDTRFVLPCSCFLSSFSYFIITFYQTLSFHHFSQNHPHFYSYSPLFLRLSFPRYIACFLLILPVPFLFHIFFPECLTYTLSPFPTSFSAQKCKRLLTLNL